MPIKGIHQFVPFYFSIRLKVVIMQKHCLRLTYEIRLLKRDSHKSTSSTPLGTRAPKESRKLKIQIWDFSKRTSSEVQPFHCLLEMLSSWEMPFNLNFLAEASSGALEGYMPLEHLLEKRTFCYRTPVTFCKRTPLRDFGDFCKRMFRNFCKRTFWNVL